MKPTAPDLLPPEPVPKNPRRKRKAAGAQEPPDPPPAPDPDRPHSLPWAICLFLIFSVPAIYTFYGAIKHGLETGSTSLHAPSRQINNPGAFVYAFLGIFMLVFTINLIDSIRLWRKARLKQSTPRKNEPPTEPDSPSPNLQAPGSNQHKIE